MKLDPGIASSLALSAAVGWTMVFGGARKKMIELRGARKRKCPSCGHQIHGRVCDRH